MDIQFYQKEAAKTLKRLDTEEQDIQHMLFGMMTELGELTDSYKKHYAYNKPLDMVNVMEELGDIAWYWINLCSITGINPASLLSSNLAKLRARYPENFSEEAAVNRDLDTERRILEQGYDSDSSK